MTKDINLAVAAALSVSLLSGAAVWLAYQIGFDAGAAQTVALVLDMKGPMQ